MKAATRRAVLGSALLVATLGACGESVRSFLAGIGFGAHWYKGNTHTHTLNSDGDSSPDDVVRWYREHGYDFMALTDHNVLTEVASLNALYGVDERFLIIRGEEVTDRFDTKPLHINGLGLDTLVEPQGGASVVEVLQRDVDAIRAVGGVPNINHPNFGWAITPDELRQVANTKLFEVYNGHPLVNNLGGNGVLGLEEAWDLILSQGILLYGLAVDDAHVFLKPGDATVAGPGRGWIMVRTTALIADSLLSAIERGDFYSTTGVELSRYSVDATKMRIKVARVSGRDYRVEFIGRNGRVLLESTRNPAVYRFRGDEGYVRARVTDSDGRRAWTQPVVLGP